MGLTKLIAEYLVKTTYEDLPVEVVLKTKRHILDTLGVMFPPSTLERGCAVLEEIAKDAGGKEESTLIGFGGKVPCWMAAFVNGSLCHPMDYDDTLDEFPTHPSAHTFPAALAVAEKVGTISGKEFIATVALGIDFHVRLAAAPKGNLVEDYPWFPITVFGVFSATAVAGRLLGLTPEEMVNAFGIAVDRASGITESIQSTDSEIRAIRDGSPNREGVMAALMAQKGINACKHGIEQLYKTFYNNNYDSSSLISNLGKEFMGHKVSLKPWPACRVSHTYAKAALDIAKEYDFSHDDIEEGILTVGKYGRDFLCIPIAAKQRPKLSINAKISLPYIVGLVLAKKGILIEDFFPQNLSDPKVLEIADKVKYEFDPELKGSISPGVVEVRTKSGRSFSKREDVPYGHPKNPMNNEELLVKFRNCARFSKKKMSEEKLNKLTNLILALENVRNIKEITEILS